MKDTHRKRHTNRPIKILSYNTGRAALAHEIALNEAYFSSVDIILIQEPYIFHERHRRITKNNPSYDTFSHINDWISTRPRVMTYVRKGSGLYPEQADSKSSGDVLHLRLNLPSGRILNVFNIYNAPGSNTESSLHNIYSLPSNSFKGNCLLKGDFNLQHTRW